MATTKKALKEFVLPVSGYQEALFHAACAYLTRGYSVIPVYGDIDQGRAKVAAVSWSAYQHSRCTAADAYRWCVEGRNAGVAIVTGRISQLCVLDFDDMARFDEFQRDHPDLADTYTVETRRGRHLYFKVFPSVQIESRKASGVDLQFEARYVVAVPTIISGHRYRVTRDTAPKTICETDVQRIYAFLAAINEKKSSAPVFTASTGILDHAQMTAGDLVALYRHLAPRIGRNEALFRVCLRARDSCCQREAVSACLADLHAGQNSSCQRRNESHEQRHREAVRTIDSAFSRPARPRRDNSSYNNAQVPNSVREALFQLRQTFTVRVLEGLRRAGIQPGQPFTTAEALEKLKGKVGRDTVYHALQAITVGGEFIFPRATPTLGEPTLATADIERHPTYQKKCSFDREQKSGIRAFHRPARRFVMPGNLELCQKLGVNPSRSDPLTEDDLRSAQRTRQAAHRELIKRRPGIYPRRWLSRRLGVTIRTLHGYNQDVPIQVRPVYLSIPITWTSLNHIPVDFDLKGTFLQDETGKKYPPKQEIAAKLLAKGHSVVYRRQTASFYSYGEGFSHGALPSSHQRVPIKAPNTLPGNLQRLEAMVRTKFGNPLSAAWEQPHQSAFSTTGPIQQVLLTASASTTRFRDPQHKMPVKPKGKSKRFYRKPLADKRMEYLAQQVHLETGGNASAISLANARRLVDAYGAQPVESALKRMAWLQRKGKIRNPAGFMIVASRVAWRINQGGTGFGSPAPRFKGERRRKGRRVYETKFP